MKKLIILFFALSFFANSINAKEIIVSQISSLASTINNAVPGDTIIVKDGVYSGNGMTLTAKGSANAPILIKAETSLNVELTGSSYFDLRACEYLTFSGFVFTSTDKTIFKLQSCNHIRLTGNIFRLNETSSLKWIIIQGLWNDAYKYSHHNRIDHNLFENKTQGGNYITIDGTIEPTLQVSQHDVIDHNYFRKNQPRAVNEKESIRAGSSFLSESSGYTLIEQNLFEECDGDPEIISVKCNDNIIRGNTFRRSQGTLSLRHGNRSRIDGNFFLGEGAPGTGGIRIYGDDHIVVNNYFEGLTGNKWDAPITLTNGDVESGSGSLSSHFRINRAIIAYNTLVNNDYGIEIGFDNNGSYSKPPRDVVMAYNLVKSDKNPLVTYYTTPVNFSWIGNFAELSGTASLGATFTDDQISLSNSGLDFDGSLWLATSSTPSVTVDPSLDGINLVDMQGQLRSSLNMTGADEFISGPVYSFPLDSADIGPWSSHPDYVPEEFSGTPYINLSPLVLNLAPSAQTVSISVSSNTSWSVSSDADWITADPLSGNGNGMVQLSIEENILEQSRSAIISFSDTSGLTENISVSQQEKPGPEVMLEILNLTASTFQDPNIPENVLDSNLSTRWSGDGDGAYLLFDLGKTDTVSFVKIAVYKGDSRTATFDIQASLNATDFFDVLTNITSNGLSADLEKYDFENVEARFIKLVGHGNSTGTWNSYTGFEIWGFPGLSNGVKPSIPAVQDAVRIYPNPINSGNCNIYLSQSGILKAELYNSFGRKLFASTPQHFSEGLTTLHLPDLGAGIYYFRFTLNNKIQVEKLVISNDY
ncbi:MAG: discoidin domain-containing protein [Bacteroidales bacterium]|nr:discoidin domain-containing protein [Bacteroidales bacterium]